MRIAGILLASALLSGCALQSPGILGIRDVRVSSGKDGVMLESLLSVYNPNPRRLIWKKHDIDIQLQQVTLGHLSGRQKLVLMPMDSTLVPVQIKTSLSTLGSAALPILASWMSGKPLIICVQGKARVRYGMFAGNIQFKHSEEIFPSK